MRRIAAARALFELTARTAGASAAALAVPLFGGLGIASALIFPSNGLSAKDVVLMESMSAGARAALWIGWIALSVPPARALLAAPSAAWLRSLPVRRAWLVGLLVLWLLALQAPWIVLFARGGGALAAVRAGVTGAALAAGLASARAMRWEALALLGPAACVVVPVPAAAAVPLALPACVLAARAGFFRGVAHPRGGVRFVRGPATTALTGVLIARLIRGERAAVTRALLAAVTGGLLGALGARNNGTLDGRFPWVVLPIATLPLVIGAGVLSRPVVRAGATLAWLLDTTAVRPLTRVAARFLASSLTGAASGLVASAAALGMASVPASVAVLTVCALSVWGASIGALASFVAHRAARAGKREGGVAVTGLSGLGIASVLTAGWLDAPALLVAPVAVLAAAAVDTYDAAVHR